LTSSIELTTHPNDIDRFVAIANKTAVRCDAFLRNDYEFWRWIHIVVDENGVHRPASQRFKNMPTLAVYTMGIMTWLAARELVVKAGQQHRLHDDRARLERHRFATSVRPEFDKYHPDPARSLPRTIPENIKYRIRAFPIASSRQPTNRICQFYYLAVNWMTNKQKRGDPFDLLMPADTVLCTLDPNALGSPNLEIEMEEAAGVDTL